VAALFVAKGVRAWGSAKQYHVSFDLHLEREPGDIDLIDLAVRQTILHNGVVHVLDSEELPDSGTAAAILRW
jgi:hypothetical protein